MDEGISIKKNIAWNSAGNIVYLFLQWLLTYLVVRLLGFEEAGNFSLAMAIAGTLVSFSLYGMRNYQVSDLTHEFSDTTYIRSRIITSAISLLVCLVIVVVGQYSVHVSLCVMFYMGFKISEALSDVYQGIQQRAMRLDYVGKAFLIKGILSLIFFAGALLVTKSLVVAILVMSIVTFSVIFIYEKKNAKKYISRSRPKSSSISRLLIICLPLAMFTLIFNALGQLPRFFIEMQLGAEELGFYTSIAMPVVIIQVSASYIFSPLITPLASLIQQRDLQGFMRMTIKVLAVILLFFAFAFVLFALMGDSILLLLFGSEIGGHVYLLMPLVICAMLTAVAWFLTSLLVVLRKQMILLGVTILSFIAMIATVLPLIETFGSNGASYSLIVSLTLCSLICFVAVTFFLMKDEL